MGKNRWLAGVFVLLMGCTTASAEDTVRKTAQEFTAALQEGNISKAEEYADESADQVCDNIEDSFDSVDKIFSEYMLSDETRSNLNALKEELLQRTFENAEIKKVTKVSDTEYTVLFSMDYLNTSEITKFFTGDEYKAYVTELSLESSKLLEIEGEKAAADQMMEKLADYIYSSYQSILEEAAYARQDSTLIIRKQNDGSWLVAGIE